MKYSIPNIAPKKSIAIGVAVVVLILVLWIAIKLFSRKRDPIQDAAIKELKPQNLTLSRFEFESLANQLQNELYEWGFFNGPDKEDLIDILSKLQTRDDFLMLVSVFGVRKNERYVLGKWEGDLFFWLSQRLDGDEMEAVRNQFKRVGLSI